MGWHLLPVEAPCNWQAISLKSACPYGQCISAHLSQVWPNGNERPPCYGGSNLGFHAMLYKVSSLDKLIKQLFEKTWQGMCLNIDSAMAALSKEFVYYAVPSVQRPGFL